MHQGSGALDMFAGVGVQLQQSCLEILGQNRGGGAGVGPDVHKFRFDFFLHAVVIDDHGDRHPGLLNRCKQLAGGSLVIHQHAALIDRQIFALEGRQGPALHRQSSELD